MRSVPMLRPGLTQHWRHSGHRMAPGPDGHPSPKDTPPLLKELQRQGLELGTEDKSDKESFVHADVSDIEVLGLDLKRYQPCIFAKASARHFDH